MVERLGRRLAGSVLLWDIVATVLTLHSTVALRLWLDYGSDLTQQQAQLPWPLYVVVAVVWSIAFLMLTPQRALFVSGLVEAIGRLFAAVALATLSFAGILYLSIRDVSRLQFIYFAVMNLLVLLVLHISVRFVIRLRRYRGQRRTLIVGQAAQGQQLVREFERRPWVGIHVVGIATDEPIADATVPVLGSINETARIVAEHTIDEVVFMMQHQDEVAKLSLQLVQQPVMLHMVPSVLDLTFARTPVETVGGIPLISLRESALTDSQHALKQLFDKIGSAVLLLLFSPLMLLIAILIKWESPGPVFFTQERIGEHGKRFRMIKFRSMYQDAEQRWAEVARRDAQGRLLHKLDNDPRITGVGAKLRRTSLDELPQLFNVLRGEMSLVGPRPEMPYIAQEYEPWQWQRFRVPPGMTGWWQVNGRAEKLMHLNTEDDLYYIQNYSFWLDLKILWMTLGAVVRGQGAF
jgi:exopolysaccharide biosynthesis polyprenyl glycosylphosphotransferase